MRANGGYAARCPVLSRTAPPERDDLMEVIQVKRREFITLLGGAGAALYAFWPVVARAQQPDRIRRIGMLIPPAEKDPEAQAWVAAFREGLEKLGWTDGQNIRIETRWGVADANSMQRVTTQLVALQLDVIITNNTPTVRLLLQQTRTIPIVFVNLVDPVSSGLVASLARPGGNATGFTIMDGTMAGKWLELLKQIAPHVTRVAFLFNPATATYAEHFLGPYKTAAPSLGLEATAAPFRDASELESTVAAHAREPNGGLIVMPETYTTVHRAAITSLAAHHRLPAIYPFRFFTEVGGLLSYGNEMLDNYPRAASYVDRILNGTKPSDLPVQLPTKFWMAINLKSAKALGLAVPDTLLARADNVIE
jgi:putative ABC transport system substrate-binding protein